MPLSDLTVQTLGSPETQILGQGATAIGSRVPGTSHAMTLTPGPLPGGGGGLACDGPGRVLSACLGGCSVIHSREGRTRSSS